MATKIDHIWFHPKEEWTALMGGPDRWEPAVVGGTIEPTWVLPPQGTSRINTNLKDVGGEFLLKGPARRYGESTNLYGRLVDPQTGERIVIGGQPVVIERESDGSKNYGGASRLARKMQWVRQGKGSNFVSEKTIDPASLALREEELGPEDLNIYENKANVRESQALGMFQGGRQGALAWSNAQKERESAGIPEGWRWKGGDPAELVVEKKRGDWSPEYGLLRLPYRNPDGRWEVVSVDPGVISNVVTKNPDAIYASDRIEELTAGKEAQQLNNEYKTPVISERALANRAEEGQFRNLSDAELADPALKDAIGFVKQTRFVQGGGGRTITSEVPVFEMRRKVDQEPLYRLGTPYARQYDKLQPALEDLMSRIGRPTGIMRNLPPEKIVQEIQARAFREQGMDPEKRNVQRIPARTMAKQAAEQGVTFAGAHTFVGPLIEAQAAAKGRDPGAYKAQSIDPASFPLDVRVPQVVVAAGGRVTDTPTDGSYLRVNKDFYDQLSEQPYGVGPFLGHRGFRSAQEKNVYGGGIDPRPPMEVDTELGRLAYVNGWRPAEEVQGLLSRKEGVQGMSMMDAIREMGPVGGPPIDRDVEARTARAMAEFGLISAKDPWAELTRRRQLLRQQAENQPWRGMDPAAFELRRAEEPVAASAPSYEGPIAIDMPGRGQIDADVDDEADEWRFRGLSSSELGTPWSSGFKTLDRPDNPISQSLEPFVQVASELGAADPVTTAELAMRLAGGRGRPVTFDDVVEQVVGLTAPPVRQVGADGVGAANRSALRSAYKVSGLPRLQEIVPDRETREVLLATGLDRALDHPDPAVSTAAEKLLTLRQVARAQNSSTPPSLEPYYSREGITASRPAFVAEPEERTLNEARMAYEAAVRRRPEYRQRELGALNSSVTPSDPAAQASYERMVDYWQRAGARARAEQALNAIDGRYITPVEQLDLLGRRPRPVDRQEPARLRQLLQEMAAERIS